MTAATPGARSYPPAAPLGAGARDGGGQRRERDTGPCPRRSCQAGPGLGYAPL
jgi:hypothetical protein